MTRFQHKLALIVQFSQQLIPPNKFYLLIHYLVHRGAQYYNILVERVRNIQGSMYN